MRAGYLVSQKRSPGPLVTGSTPWCHRLPTPRALRSDILIDGQRLAGLMIKFGVGVQIKQAVQIVEVDEDFFE